MRQLITRIDDDLHARLKARAAAEGRSLNSLVTELLAEGVASDRRAVMREALARRSKLVVPESPDRVPSRQAALRATRGAGRAVSRALEEERAGR